MIGKNELPDALGAAVLSALSIHKGKSMAVSRSDLVRMVAARGVKVHDRELRKQIRKLRRQGELICSTSGEDGGYYLAADWAEFETFATIEYDGKISDMAGTVKAMRESARREFGEAQQMELPKWN